MYSQKGRLLLQPAFFVEFYIPIWLLAFDFRPCFNPLLRPFQDETPRVLDL